MAEFDDLVTGPVHGFPNAEAYWAASSSGPLLRKIRRPTLLINARDDPFMPVSSLPVDAVSANRFLTAEFTPAGGHIGFIAGAWPGRPVPWAEERIIQFFQDHLHRVD
jgi:predicted alpha/beta-fold hydrolase